MKSTRYSKGNWLFSNKSQCHFHTGQCQVLKSSTDRCQLVNCLRNKRNVGLWTLASSTVQQAAANISYHLSMIYLLLEHNLSKRVRCFDPSTTGLDHILVSCVCGDHCRATGHSVSMKNTKVLTRDSNWHKSNVKEAIYIRQRTPTMNIYQGYYLPAIYNQSIPPKSEATHVTPVRERHLTLHVEKWSNQTKGS